MGALISLHEPARAIAADYGPAGGSLTIDGTTAEMMRDTDNRLRDRGSYSATLFMPAHRAAELAQLWNRPGTLTLYELLLREIDPRLLQAQPSPTGGLLYRRCHLTRLPLGAPVAGWEWQHEDAEPGDPRHGVCGTVAGCLDEIDELHAEAIRRGGVVYADPEPEAAEVAELIDPAPLTDADRERLAAAARAESDRLPDGDVA